MIELKQLEYHVVDGCNLACEFCSHYSNFKGPANILEIDQIEEEWRHWSEKIRPNRLHLIGGEPLLHPKISEIVALAFRVWPLSRICLYSNGLLLKKHPTLRKVLKGGQFALGLHYCDERDQETERNVTNYFLGTGTDVSVIDGSKGWLKFYDFDEAGRPVPYRDNDQRASWENCVAAQQKCFVLRNNYLWKCPQIAYSDRAGVADWFADYLPCSADSDILEWTLKEDEKCCLSCPAAPQPTPHGKDFMRPRLPVIQPQRPIRTAHSQMA